ncbi:hypothetical protein AV530_000978 [Patagioenas fasciata monilis]|uniref:Uncharacterized protein n=1 Tax=Patagioenas fasciata monilis TaxID=372326 RepID=A0A1V4KSV1_PATFA|nr:hypothetical protein AV530_000978 [Patagioenas fasciata monilis]
MVEQPLSLSGSRVLLAALNSYECLEGCYPTIRLYSSRVQFQVQFRVQFRVQFQVQFQWFFLGLSTIPRKAVFPGESKAASASRNLQEIW